MAEVQATRRWAGRALFVGLSFTFLFAQILPLNMVPDRIAAPDILVAFTLAWVIRRPDLTPVALIALVHFSADILLDRPPGLWAALIVISTEILRNRAADLRALAFPFEWLLVTGTLVGLFISYRIILTILVLQQAPLMLTLTQLTITILVYPLVVLLSYLAFGVSRPAMGEVDDLGRRL